MGIFDAAFLISAITSGAPILLAATGELVSERAGVLNVGLEGVMLAGAFGGYLVMCAGGPLPLGFVGGVLAGLLFGALMAALSVEAKVDQIVSGIALILLGYGLTAFLNERLYGSPRTFAPLRPVAVPLLSRIPGIGRPLFGEDVFVYAVAVVFVLVVLALRRTTWGINVHATGESPLSADAAGISVRGLRWTGVLFSGACAGAAGAYLSIGEVGVFREGMTAGRGYLAIAAVLFGAWRMGGMLLAVAIFAAADATQLRLQAAGTIPREVWVAAAVIVAGALVAGRLRREGHRLLARTRPGVGTAAGVAALVVLVALAGRAPHVTLPVSLWLGLPYALALIALAGESRNRHRTPSALTIPYLRSEA